MFSPDVGIKSGAVLQNLVTMATTSFIDEFLKIQNNGFYLHFWRALNIATYVFRYQLSIGYLTFTVQGQGHSLRPIYTVNYTIFYITNFDNLRMLQFYIITGLSVIYCKVGCVESVVSDSRYTTVHNDVAMATKRADCLQE